MSLLAEKLTKVAESTVVGDTFLVSISQDEAADLFDLALAAVNTLFTM